MAARSTSSAPCASSSARGVSAVQLEDQEWPKKCGHEPGRKVASSTEMEQRIKAAADARVDADVMIVARTDAIASEGFEAALERAARYREAGADILFVEAPPSEADLAAVPKRLGVPCLANMVEGGAHAGAAVPQAGAARLQGRDLSQLADAAVRPRRPGPAAVRSRRRATRPPWPTRCSTTASSGRCSRTSAGRRWRSASRRNADRVGPIRRRLRPLMCRTCGRNALAVHGVGVVRHAARSRGISNRTLLGRRKIACNARRGNSLRRPRNMMTTGEECRPAGSAQRDVCQSRWW